jgi:hypothetical protein
MDVGAELKGKVGPFPLYVWLLIMTGGALAAYMLLKKKNAGQQKTGTPGTPCTQQDGSAGTWDSTGTVCQATTVSTVNAPTDQGRSWRSQSTTATATTGTATTGTDTGTVASTTPPPATTIAAPGGRLTQPTGLGIQNGKTGVRIRWTPVPGATSYTCQAKKGGRNGQSVNGPFTVMGPVCNFGGLKSKTQYTALIWPGDSTDPGGPGSNQPHVEFAFTTL